MRNPDMVYVPKMEYVSKINIFGLNMMVKSGLKKKNIFCDVCTYNTKNFKPQISTIFNFEYVNEAWMSGVLCVKANFSVHTYFWRVLAPMHSDDMYLYCILLIFF